MDALAYTADSAAGLYCSSTGISCSFRTCSSATRKQGVSREPHQRLQADDACYFFRHSPKFASNSAEVNTPKHVSSRLSTRSSAPRTLAGFAAEGANGAAAAGVAPLATEAKASSSTYDEAGSNRAEG